jgi:hypothetical protein
VRFSNGSVDELCKLRAVVSDHACNRSWRLSRNAKKETGPEIRTRSFQLRLFRCVSPLAASLPGTNSQRYATRLFTSVTALFIPKFCGKLLQLWTIFETIIAIAISAPTIRITSCDDLIFDLPMTRIFKASRLSCLGCSITLCRPDNAKAGPGFRKGADSDR